MGSTSVFTLPNWPACELVKKPRVVLQHLKSVNRAGTHFDSLYIVHEEPKGVAKRGNEAEVLRVIAPPSPSDIAQLSATLGRLSLGTLLAAFPALALANAGKTGSALARWWPQRLFSSRTRSSSRLSRRRIPLR